MHRPPQVTTQMRPYLLAVTTVAMAALIRYGLGIFLGESAPLLIFTLPVVICASFAGAASAITATVLSMLIGNFSFIPPVGSFAVLKTADEVRLVLFAIIGIAMAWVGAVLQKSRSELRHGEERYRLLVQGAHDIAMFYVSPEGLVQSWNEGAQRIKGYTEPEIIGKHISTFYTEEDRNTGQVENLLRTAAACGSARCEGRRVRKNGEQFWADVILTALYDGAGHVRGFSKITYDRTREHALLKSLEESEQTSRALLESTAQAVIGINASGKIQLVNKTAEQMFGYPREELIGQMLELLLPNQARARHRQQRSDYFQHARPRPMGQGMELSARRRDGEIFPIEASINMCDTPKGPMAVSFVTDITKRKQIENDLAMERSQLKSILEYSPLLVSITDLAGRIILANQSWGDVLGVDHTQLIGKSMFDIYPPDVAKLVWQRDQEALRGKGAVRSEEQIRLKDGASYTYETVRFPVSYINSREPFGLCTFALDITEKKEAEQRALHAAQHDPLTDLPNRALMYEFGNHMIAAAKRANSELAVLFFDLDRFKLVNDTYGHEVGDKMLQEVAQRITRTVRNSDLVGRLGGDEFVAFLTVAEREQSVRRAAYYLLEALREPYLIGGLELRVSPSIGISLYPGDGTDVDTLIRHADAAMYHAKANGRNTYQFFSEDTDVGNKRVFALEQRLRRSFHESEFELHYQPIIETRSMRVYGVEALIRWRQKGAELVMPNEFISAAEACGLINQLGAWVLAEACQQQIQWQENGLPQLHVAVNVSPIQFRSHDFEQRVESAIRSSGILPEYLELEVTESMVMREIKRTTETLQALKRLGVRISLDDFGTGYSSLSHLSRLPIDKLKVDQSFVRNIESDKRSLVIAETVIGMGKKLGVDVVAEGIESEEALDLLRERACDLGQGYLFGAPMKAAQFEDWYRSTHQHGLYH